MPAFHQLVSRKEWTQDFSDILALKPRSTESVHALIHQKYHDKEWKEEYRLRLWNALCYFVSIQPKLENAGLSVVGEKGALTKNSVQWALYSHFAACDASVAHIMDVVPLDKVLALAKSCEK
jgi:hypothetical protein